MTHTQTVRIGLSLVLGLALVAACAPKKKTYTVPQVTSDIEGALKKVRDLKGAGKLDQASKVLVAISKAVLNDFPEATVTQEPVKKLLEVLDWMANLCLDRSLELKNEAVSPAEDKQSRQFRQWSDDHRENLVKLRKLLPTLQAAQVAPRPGAGPAGPAADPMRESPSQPRDSVPSMDPGGMEPGGAEPGGMEPGAGEQPRD
jgi:hypothetical protein